ncbi:hypothetical protein TRAPUB_1664 [Trametes pubescens]|uniref:F-box domain-containing protein n=1 Tax=Trametes pubescens TaxID=154538 RepID=A0A1M2VIS8_TRAPU|nr:hypothetical protein TRAPUB_1664 [Trametes pubescens]
MTTGSDGSDRVIANAYRSFRLPTELWDLILKDLPRTDQQTCLSVSKLFSDRARPLLFSRLTINIGLWKAYNNRNYLANEVQVIERHDLRNTELLQHVACDVRFASIVKEINVRAHDRHGWCNIEFVRLQTLTIAGSSRQFPRHIIPEVERKIKACVVRAPVTLRHLSVSVYSLLDAPLRMLSGMHTLCSCTGHSSAPTLYPGRTGSPCASRLAQLKGRPSLGYLHILESARDLDLCRLLLEDPLPALELVGYGSCLGRIARGSDGTATYGPLWDNTTLVFRTAEDFRPGCEDWKWLLRGHDWEGLREYHGITVLRAMVLTGHS